MASAAPQVLPDADLVTQLPVTDGHRLHVEVAGPAEGVPVVLLHGGPGSGCPRGFGRAFEGPGWRRIAVDQRGAGRSRPSAGAAAFDLSSITTDRLVADLERLREHLELDAWVLYGVSWGVTLGLAYAAAHASRVLGAVFGGVTTTSQGEVEWVTDGLARFFPVEHELLRAALPAGSEARVVDAFATLLADPDPAVHEPAARAWCAWEDAILRLEPDESPDPRFEDATFRLTFARQVTHVWSRHAWLDQASLLGGLAPLAGVPCELVHGHLDLQAPLVTAVRVQRAWEGARLSIVSGAGHGGGEAFAAAVDAAAARVLRAVR